VTRPTPLGFQQPNGPRFFIRLAIGWLGALLVQAAFAQADYQVKSHHPRLLIQGG
jgi:hypothetical protein